MYDFNRNEFHHRHVFYLDADGCIHPIPEYRFDRLCTGYPDAALPQQAGQRARFAIFHVAHRTDPMRVVDEIFHALPLDIEGNVDAQQDHDALQADVDRLETNNYAPPEPSYATESRTSWVPDTFTHRRLIAALLDVHHQPRNSWWPHDPSRAA